MADYLWWQTGVIYQIYPRSFQDSDGDGVGDLQGVIERLDHPAETLGVDAIWLSPFYPSPMADFGYDVADYRDVDPIFGDLATFDRLVAEAHRRGLRVIIDWVPNHTSDRHPWFLESRSSRENPKRDWYVWRDPRPDGGLPNNWLSAFGGPAWQWDESTGQYYLHVFLAEQPDLNWRNPDVEEAMLDTLRFWLERGVDGFRIDVAHVLMKDPELRDNPPAPDPRPWLHGRPIRDYDRQLHVYDRGHSDVHEVYRRIRRLLDDYGAERSRVAIGEIYLSDWPQWASYYGAGDELHMPLNFGLLFVPWEGWAVRQVVDALEAAIPEGSWPNYVLGNHDVSRLASRYGEAQARVAAMLLLTLRGTPTLYYGDELGMTDVSIPPARQRDPQGIREPGLGRDPARTPMQWTAGPRAGFTDGEPWLPVSADHRRLNVETQLGDPTSILALYRRLLADRRRSLALQHGGYRPLDVPPWAFAYLREGPEERILVALNLAGDEGHLDLADLGPARVVLSTHLDREGPEDLHRLLLRPGEGLVIHLGKGPGN